MPASLAELDPGKDFPRLARFVAEIPKHSSNIFSQSTNSSKARRHRFGAGKTKDTPGSSFSMPESDIWSAGR
jgi:hypothetical protein